MENVIFQSHTFMNHVSMHAIETSFPLKLVGVGSSILPCMSHGRHKEVVIEGRGRGGEVLFF
jgi:hypothetical protein